jgi:ABC-type glycerol-3-phosphate transport system substrate-binding protein
MIMHVHASKFLRLFGTFLILLTGIPGGVQAKAVSTLPGQGTSWIYSPAEADSRNNIEVQADSYGLPLGDTDAAKQYDKPSVALKAGDSVSFKVSIKTAGEYQFYIDMAAPNSFLKAPQGQLLVDNAPAAGEPQNIVFPVFYKNSVNEIPLDRYGNQTLIKQVNMVHWTKVPLRDANFSNKYPLEQALSAGEHELKFALVTESILLGSIYIEQVVQPLSYNEYLQATPAEDTSGVSMVLEAENPSYKNNTSIRPINDRGLEVTPYDTYSLLLNTLGGDKWKDSGSAVFYEFEAPQEGMYNITLRSLQNFTNNFTSFRRITINGQVLFDELNEVPFRYTSKWTDITLGGETPYRIYLQKGKNVLGIEANNSPYETAIEHIKQALIDINELSLEVKKLTGNQVDRYREWNISLYIPDIVSRLNAIADNLTKDRDMVAAVNQSTGSQQVLTYQMAIDNIRYLAKDPDKISIRLTRFSEGSGSAASLLGTLLPTLQDQPLLIDKIIIHSPDILPTKGAPSFFTSFTEATKRFIHSFAPDPYQTLHAGNDELDVWVNRPRQYVDLLQTMTDQTFTQQTGIKVKFSIMPDESKLILANAAGTQPDVALGVSTNQPYELAIRNALYDLRSFPDFDSFIRIYSPGSLLSYIINDSAYAIPETQDFWVTFYRKDILKSLNIPVPHTWPEVIAILPELQRYGMNYNTPLSEGAGTKPLLMTAPYIFNYGASMYSADGFSTGLGSDQAIKAIKFMADSFTIYGMPLTTANFYDSFRYGSMPIGVSNFTDYVRLLTAAPELNGLWGIDLYPATVLDDGTENRYATGSAQCSIMFKNTEKAEQGWQFMKWWMSTETQVDFQQQLILNYGMSYLWTSANVEAFQYLPIPQEHIDVILKQWQWLQEPVKLPGSYMEERELSNVWNEIVFDGVNPRVAIDHSVVTINREITRKMTEFGYLQDGKIVKQFKIPTIETVKNWMQDGQ